MVDGNLGVVGEFNCVADYLSGRVLHIRDGLYIDILLKGLHNALEAFDVGVDLGHGVLQVLDILLKFSDVLFLLVQTAHNGGVVVAARYHYGSGGHAN